MMLPDSNGLQQLLYNISVFVLLVLECAIALTLNEVTFEAEGGEDEAQLI